MTQPPPIIPGYPDQPATFPAFSPPPPSPARRKGRAGLITLIAAGAVISVGLVLVGLTVAGKALGIGHTALRGAHDKCAAGILADGDKTLILDLSGTEAGSGTASMDDLRCYVSALSIPAYVVSKMEHTRALDGQVSERWEGFEATWTYHPDQGLDLLIREV